MQSHQNSFGSDSLKNRGHRRSDTLGKAMPITSLLLNYTPSSLQQNENIRSDADDRGHHHRSLEDISPTQQERPPLYFPINDHENLSPRERTKSHTGQDTDDDLDLDLDLDQDYEILISECSSSMGESDHDDDRRKSNSEEYISLIGNSKFYAPCLTCVGSAPSDLAQQPTAINEMCRRLCTEECRLRLSLLGLVKSPLETAANTNRELLENHVRETLDAPPQLPPRPENEKTSKAPFKLQKVPKRYRVNKPPPIPRRPPAHIAIQRKKFLSEILTQKFTDSDSSYDDDKLIDRRQNPPRDLLDIVASIVVPPPTPSVSPVPGSSSGTTTIDPHELVMLKDFREKFEIAEALAKTSAMTSTTQIKQRLAARKLEMELDNVKSIMSDDDENGAATVTSQEGNKTSIGKQSQQSATQQGVPTTSATTIDAVTTAAGEKLALSRPDTKSSASASSLSGYHDDYEPPRDLLLYLVSCSVFSESDVMCSLLGSTRHSHTLFMITIYLRKLVFKDSTPMGSFNAAPKINNVDSQDDDLELPKELNTSELLQHVKHLRGDNRPPLLSRFFLKPLSPSLISTDVTDGLRCLKLNSVSRVCSAPISDENHIRLLQWNLLSQTLGQNNDGFVRCPEEALTWENRKFLIVQEILQNNPDIVCLQEVDHFKFLQAILGSQNYEGIFFPKPDSPCLYIEENNGPDGCAIFFKRDKFDLRNFDTRILEVWRVQSNQVAIAVNLLVKKSGREICVCTTHLKARHGSLLSKLRNEQGRDLIRFVTQFAGERPLLLCGDFNAEPTEPVYATVLNCEFLNLSSAYADIRAESDECNNESLKNGLNECDKVQKSIETEPPYTTWKIREDGEECHTIDYVFYTKEQFKVKNCLEFPQGDEIGQNRTPSFQYPSDHFSLICDFEILDTQSNQNSLEKSKAQ